MDDKNDKNEDCRNNENSLLGSNLTNNNRCESSELEIILDKEEASNDFLEDADILLVSQNNRIITRQFALIPEDMKNKAIIYRKMDQYFKYLIILQNCLLHKMYDSLKDGICRLEDFASTSKPFIEEHIFNPLHFSEERKRLQIQFKQRLVKCATDSPFQAFRNWLVRNHNLALIANELSSKFSNPNNEENHDLLSNFLRDGTLPYGYLKDILSEKLSHNIFGEKEKDLSNPFIMNMVKQLRNLLYSYFRSEIDDFLLKKLLEIRKDLELVKNKTYFNKFSNFCLSTFYRTVEKKKELVPISDLLRYFLDNYFTTLKRNDTKRKKRNILKSNSVVSYSELNVFLKKIKTERNEIYNRIKVNILNSLENFNLREIVFIAFRIISEQINNHPNTLLSKLVFNPTFSRFRFSEPSFENFAKYLGNILYNKVRSNIRELFICPELFGIISELLRYLSYLINENDINTIKLPEIQSGALTIINLDVVTGNHSDTINIFNQLIKSKKFQLSFLPNEFLNFDIVDNKKNRDRISQIYEKYSDRVIKIRYPTITYNNHKLILHLPFEIKRKESLSEVKNEERVLGLDLNLTVFGVISIFDKMTLPPKEIARYFIGQKQLFDMKFINGRFIKQDRFKNPKNSKCNQCISNGIECDRCNSNIKRRLISIHKEIQDTQSKQDARAHELKEREIIDYNSDAEYKRLKNRLSELWNRVCNINLEIVRVLSHDIIEIAKFHSVDIIQVEDLRFSEHRKRNDVGRFISFWQVHWLFSAIQDAIELQAYLNRIEFRRVRPEYTSQRCSMWCYDSQKEKWIICSKIGERDGKIFRCKEKHFVLNYKTKKLEWKPIQLDADLNASRNIALAEA